MSHEFDLTQLYASFREAENDLSNLCSLIQALEEMRGKLRRELERAILLMQKIAEIHDKLVCFSDLVASTNALSPEVLLDVRELQHGTSVQSEIASSFWREEVSRLDAEILKSSRSPVVRAHACFLSKHCNTAHRLPRKVEQMIEKVEPLGAMAWTEYLDHILDELQFVHPSDNEEMLGFDEMFELLSSGNSAVRRLALSRLNDGLTPHAGLATEALKIVAKQHALNWQQRGHPHRMALASDGCSGSLVQTLEAAVRVTGKTIAQPYFELMKTDTGGLSLSWADHMAPAVSPPPADEAFTFDYAVETVLAAFRGFSPELESLAKESLRDGTIDPFARPGKVVDNFTRSLVLPEPVGPRSYVCLNFSGAEADVLILGHQLGHAARGILAGRAQGALQFCANPCVQQSLSIFCENLVLDKMLEQARNARERYRLLTVRINWWLTRVLTRTAQSLFETFIHQGDPDELTVERLCKTWKRSNCEVYGFDTFEFVDMDYMWVPLTQLHAPFDGYDYAVGELVSGVLWSRKAKEPDRVASCVIDMM